ncbi:winged helix-turn-helix transcriptional regulator [Clavibacter michiganensis subsp. phaseoli]|uniref:Winged helix-turn-helix transcriptional regulator n=1 Tax=Clavibacter phaseoli TaxID=1734031 RepID=A0A8I0VBB4_9MICO|nr:helix-turn-helix domain-containing protein [Clavibacter phaseoli]MBF4631261.1 winged helix-turn-helix transcriptional regulator [Clavibacter phaseoli]
MTDEGTRVLEALRGYAVRYQESAHAFARFMGLPTSDGTALGEILWAERSGLPMTAARLRTRLGMTSGATTALVDRLQARGLVERSRESDDRRIVTLRTTDEVRARSAGFHGPAARELEAAMGEHDDATLAVVRGFLERLTGVLPTGEGGAPAS